MFEWLPVPEYVAWIIVTVSAIYWVATRNHGYWKKAGVPYIPAWPFIGSYVFNSSKLVHESEMERIEKYGRIYGIYEGNNPSLVIADPELLKNIFVKDFQVFPNQRSFGFSDPIARHMLGFLNGEQWKRVRSIMSSTFTTGKLKRMMNIFDECADTLIENLLKAAEEGKTIDVKETVGAYGMDVIASAAFSTKLDSHNDPNNKFVQMAKIFSSLKPTWRFFVIIIFPTLAKYMSLRIFDKKATNFFRDLTIEIIEERKRSGQKRNDFLQLLLDANKENDEADRDATKNDNIDANYSREGNDEQIVKNVYKKKPLTTDEILAQSITFFVAGYGATSIILSYATYEIATNTEIQDKLIKDVDRALNDSEGKLTYEAIQQMKYMDNVISEVLRLYPAQIRGTRTSVQDYVLGDTGITIPKGTQIIATMYPIHQNPEYYPDPKKFDPDRFLPEERSKRPAFAYLPFGGGPRNCVAMRFVLLHLKTVLARILSRFRLSIAPEMKVPLEFESGTFVMVPKPVLLQLHVRDDVPT